MLRAVFAVLAGGNAVKQIHSSIFVTTSFSWNTTFLKILKSY